MSRYHHPVARLLDRAQPGSRKAVAAHIRRGDTLSQLIAQRWPAMTRPEQWRVKHVRWALEHGLADRSPGTRYHYYRTARVIGAALNRWPHWVGYLNGPWRYPDGRQPDGPRPAGGRPPKLARRH